MTRISNAALVAACEQMLTENIAYTTLDCQEAVEEALRAGVPPQPNATCRQAMPHYRKCLWRGTPERMTDLLGVKGSPFRYLPSSEAEAAPRPSTGETA